MAKSTLSGLIAIAAVYALTGCGQSTTNSTSAVSTTQLAPAPAPIPLQNTVAQPANTSVVQPDGSVNYDQPGDRNVTVNAPFSATKVDRDTGSVHIDAPFVHIEKAGRGQKMHIDIGGDSGLDNSR
jgi:hypothetical protein